jgi:hypothetical protein
MKHEHESAFQQGDADGHDGPDAGQDQQQTIAPNIYSRFLAAVDLSEKDRQHLIQHRCLPDWFIDGRFASADPERVQRALQQLGEQGVAEADLRHAHLLNEKGRPQAYLLGGGILIAYMDGDNKVIQIRAHKDGPKDVPLEIYGLELLHDHGGHVVICEGEFKAAALQARGISAIAVPGIWSFEGKNFERLLDVLRKAGIKSVTILFDNDDKFSPTLPSGARNERYKADRFKRYDTQLCASILARRLTGDGISAYIAWLPDDWRDASGKADIDGAFRDGQTLEEFYLVFQNALAPADFLAAQTDEAQEVIRTKLCLGRPRLTSEGWKLRDGDIDVTVENSRTKRVVVVVSKNYRPVFTDRADIGSAKSRGELIKRLEKKNLKIDAATVGRMLDNLALAIESGGGEFISPPDGDAIQIGSRHAFVRPDGIYLVVGEEERQVSNFSLEFTEDQTIYDGAEETRLLRGVIHVDSADLPVTMAGSALGTPTEFAKAIFGNVGTAANLFGAGAESVVREVALAVSQPTRIKIEQQLGWDDEGCYRTPTGCFDANGLVTLPGVTIDLKGTGVAAHLGLIWIPDDQLFSLGHHILDDFREQHSHAVTYPILGHVFVAPLLSRFPMLGRPALMLRGSSGCGKTTVAREGQSFFGAGFARAQALETWLSTPNAIQRAGFLFRDALFVVDDFKLGNLRDRDGAMSILQAYADGVSRQRLTRDGRRSPNCYPIRGALLMTGEDSPSDMTSVAARITMVEVAGSPNIEHGNRCLQRAHEYCGLMGRYVSWLAHEMENLEIERRLQGYQNIFAGRLLDTPNRPRLVSNLAMNALGFELFLSFLRSIGVINDEKQFHLWEEYEGIVIKLFEANAASVGEQRGTEIFLATLRDRLATGECVLGTHPGSRPEHGGRVVGFEGEGEYVQLVMSEAYAAVQEHLGRHGRSIGIGNKTLIRDLRNEGVIDEDGQPHEVDGVRPRVWRIRRQLLGLEPKQEAWAPAFRPRSPNSHAKPS